MSCFDSNISVVKLLGYVFLKQLKKQNSTVRIACGKKKAVYVMYTVCV